METYVLKIKNPYWDMPTLHMMDFGRRRKPWEPRFGERASRTSRYAFNTAHRHKKPRNRKGKRYFNPNKRSSRVGW